MKKPKEAWGDRPGVGDPGLKQVRAGEVPEGVQVWIASPSAELSRFAFSPERLRTEAELRLSLAGVTVREAPAREWQGGPCLGVILNLQPSGSTLTCPFSLEVFYVEGQPTALGPFGPSLHLKWCRETWGEIRQGPRGLDWEPVYEALARLVQEFLDDYPGLPGTGTSARLVN